MGICQRIFGKGGYGFNLPSLNLPAIFHHSERKEGGQII
jgi:hypothetical protein